MFTWVPYQVFFFFSWNLVPKYVRSDSRTKRRSTPHQTGSLWTGPCPAKPRPVLLNCPVILRDITQRRVVIRYRHFETTFQPQIQRSGNPKYRTEHVRSSLTQSPPFNGTLSITLFFKQTWHFRSWLCFCFQGKKHLTWFTLWLSYFQWLDDTWEQI